MKNPTKFGSTELPFPLRILLIEDDEIDALAFQRAFRDMVCTVEICQRAEDALARLGDSGPPFDLVVSDHRLPGMTGLELCQILAPGERSFALVLLTGMGSESMALEALEAGIDDYIVKDTSPRGLRLLAVKLPQVIRRHRDRLARRRAEKELVRSREAALEASRVKSQFLANMSHEIRTPLNGIVGMTELVLTTGLSAQQLQYVEAIRSSTVELASVVEDILEAARIVARQIELTEQPFSLQELVEEAVERAIPRAVNKGLDLRWRVLSRLPERVYGDPRRLQQVLGKLVGNAIKFTEEGWVEVRIQPATEIRDAGCMQISVADSGIGIPPSRQGEIFEPFTQVDDTDTRRFGGAGLGLSICTSLVRLMGGRIWVESREGVGSTFHFTVRLPTVPSSAAEADPESYLALSK